MTRHWKIAVLAIIALGLGVTAFALSSCSVVPEASDQRRMQEEWSGPADKHPHFPRIHLEGDDLEVPEEFVLNAFVVEAVFFAPGEDPALVDEMHERAEMLVGERCGWATEIESVDLAAYLDSAKAPYREELVKLAWRVESRVPNLPDAPKHCIKLRTCQIKCDR